MKLMPEHHLPVVFFTFLAETHLSPVGIHIFMEVMDHRHDVSIHHHVVHTTPVVLVVWGPVPDLIFHVFDGIGVVTGLIEPL